MTTRRTFLTTAALVTLPLAGCLGDAEPGTVGDSTVSDPTTTRTAERPTDGPDHTDGEATPTDGLPGANHSNGSGDAGGTRLRGTGGPGVTLVGTDDSSGPVEHSVEVTTAAATDDTPPQLHVSITNTGEESLTVGEGRTVFFAYQQDTRKQLTLLPSGEEYPAEPGCWRLTEGIAVTEEYRTVRLAPGETARRSLDLYASPGEDACLPVGEFRFETDFQRHSATTATPPATDDVRESTWGFTVVLE